MTTFLAGFFVEFCWLAWIYFADRGWPLRTAVASMAIGGFSLMGIGHALGGDWKQIACLILGYGAGSYVAALYKQRRAKRSTDA